MLSKKDFKLKLSFGILETEYAEKRTSNELLRLHFRRNKEDISH